MLLASVLLVVGLGINSAPSFAGDSRGGKGLDASEHRHVGELAEKAIRDQGLHVGKLVLTRVDVFPESGSGSSRNAVAIFYRYEGDLAILVSVNLARRQVTKVEPFPHMPTSLAPEELALAEKLARENPEVARALARERPDQKIDVDALVPRTIDPESPYFRHRLVRLHFRVGRMYLLYGPTVDVDLHTGKVYVQGMDAGHK